MIIFQYPLSVYVEVSLTPHAFGQVLDLPKFAAVEITMGNQPIEAEINIYSLPQKHEKTGVSTYRKHTT